MSATQPTKQFSHEQAGQEDCPTHGSGPFLPFIDDNVLIIIGLFLLMLVRT